MWKRTGQNIIPHLGISLVTIGNCVLGLHQLFGLLNHLSSKTSDALNEGKKREDEET